MTTETVSTDDAPDESAEIVADGKDESAVIRDWRDDLSPDLRRMAERMASPADAVKIAADLRQKLGRSITRPDKDADDAAWDAYYKNLGRPETPDGYDYKRPQGLPPELQPDERGDQREKSFLSAMHKAGATSDIVQAAVDWYYDETVKLHSEHRSGNEAAHEKVSTALRREWGGDYDKNLELANRAAKTFGGAELMTALEQYNFANHPAFIRAFARIGRQMGEDDMITGSLHGISREDLQKKADELLKKSDYWTNDDIQKEMRQIMEELHGTAPINPSEQMG